MRDGHCGLQVCVFIMLLHLHTALAHGQDNAASIAAVTDARNPIALNRAYLEVLGAQPPDRLERLKVGLHDGIAIQAAFEQVKRTASDSSDGQATGLESDAVQRFLGFVEGRLRVPVPTWWEGAIVKGKAQKDEFFGLTLEIGPAIDSRYRVIWSDKRRGSLSAPEDVSIQNVTDDRIEFSFRKSKIGVSTSSFYPRGLCALSLPDGDVLVAVHSDIPHGLLLRTNSEMAVPKWTSSIWGEIPRYFRQGPPGFHYVEILTDGKRALVFGATNDVVYLEGFALGDGKALFRFSSAYPFSGRKEE